MAIWVEVTKDHAEGKVILELLADFDDVTEVGTILAAVIVNPSRTSYAAAVTGQRLDRGFSSDSQAKRAAKKKLKSMGVL